MTPAEIGARSARASELLAHPAFSEVMSALESSYIEGWRRTAYDNDKLREQMWRRLQALYDIKAQLELFVHEGTLSKKR